MDVAPCGANKVNRLSLGDQQDVDLKSDSGAGTEPALGGRHLEDCQPRARVQVRFFFFRLAAHHPLLTRSLIEVWSSRHFLRLRSSLFYLAFLHLINDSFVKVTK